MKIDLELTNLLKDWKTATGNLRNGEASVFHATLEMVEQGQIKLAYNTDYNSDAPCLVKANENMLENTNPSADFSDVVTAYDALNSYFAKYGWQNTSGYCSPFAAEVLLRYFGDFDKEELVIEVTPAGDQIPYREPSDESLLIDWIDANASGVGSNFPVGNELIEVTPEELESFNGKQG